VEEDVMKITMPDIDVIIVDESNIQESQATKSKVHLIKLNFAEPTTSKINAVLDLWPATNRFIIQHNIKIYNDVLKNTSKKYYVMNREDQNGIFSFFRKNNKVLLCVQNLLPAERQFVLTHALSDVLRNLEVIMIDDINLKAHADKFQNWSGNVILYSDEYRHYL
jgi:hypothetical protein